MKKGLFTILTLFFVSEAFAARYTVLFKDSKSFQKVTSTWSTSQHVKIQRVYPHLQGLLIEADNESFKAPYENVQIEEEVIHRAPRIKVSKHQLKYWNEAKIPWGLGMIKAREAWHISKGEGAKILILDSGVDRSHPAFEGQIFDAKNFVSGSEAPSPDPAFDSVGHGTHVAGTALGKELPNGFSGVAPKAKLLMARVCDETGCSSADMIAGIEWGIAQKVQVLNMSFGDENQTKLEKEAVAKAEAAGVMVIAATGNDGVGQIYYPANYQTSYAVGAVDREGKIAEFSNYGKGLNIMAPGTDILSSVPVGSKCGNGKADYCLYEGTSMASPHVAGVAALVRATNPNLTPKQVRKLLTETAIPAGDALHYGAGIVDAEKAVTKAKEMR